MSLICNTPFLSCKNHFYKNHEAQNRQKMKTIPRTMFKVSNLIRIWARLIFHPLLRIRYRKKRLSFSDTPLCGILLFFFDTESHKKCVLFMRVSLVLNCVQSNQNLLTMHAILRLNILIKRLINEGDLRGKN